MQYTWRARQKNMSPSSSGSHLGMTTTPPYRQATKLFKTQDGLRSARCDQKFVNWESFGQDCRSMFRRFVWTWVILQLHIQKVLKRRESVLFAVKDYPRYKYKLECIVSVLCCIYMLQLDMYMKAIFSRLKTQIDVKYCCDFNIKKQSSEFFSICCLRQLFRVSRCKTKLIFFIFSLPDTSSTFTIRNVSENFGSLQQQAKSIASCFWRFYIPKESYTNIKQYW